MCLSESWWQDDQHLFVSDPIHNLIDAPSGVPVNIPSMEIGQFSDNDPGEIPTEEPVRYTGVLPRIILD